jgi:hypothetical protein
MRQDVRFFKFDVGFILFFSRIVQLTFCLILRNNDDPRVFAFKNRYQWKVKTYKLEKLFLSICSRLFVCCRKMKAKFTPILPFIILLSIMENIGNIYPYMTNVILVETDNIYPLNTNWKPEKHRDEASYR